MKGNQADLAHAEIGKLGNRGVVCDVLCGVSVWLTVFLENRGVAYSVSHTRGRLLGFGLQHMVLG